MRLFWRLNGVQEVAGSNPAAPTSFNFRPKIRRLAAPYSQWGNGPLHHHAVGVATANRPAQGLHWSEMVPARI
jgi:hypothetical protein